MTKIPRKLKHFLILPLCALIFFIGAVTVQAATYYVATTGNDAQTCATAQTITTPKRTFASALPCMAPGDTLYFRGGTYDERLDFQTDAIQGSAGNYLTIAGYPGEMPTLQYTDTVLDDYGAIKARGNLGWYIFKDFKIDGSNFNATGAVSGTGWSIRDGNHDFILENLEIFNQNYNAVLLQTVSNITIRNCRLHNARTTDVVGKRFYGVYVHDGTNILIENNDIYNNGAGMQAFPGPLAGVIIRNNRIHHNNNNLTTQTVGGITVQQGAGTPITGVQIYNNLIYKNGNPAAPSGAGNGWGINIGGPVDGTKIWNNTITLTQGPDANGSWGLTLNGFPQPTNTVIENNIFWQNPGGAATGLQALGTIFNHNMLNTTNPFFVNEALFDFHLLAGSPAIDAGVTLSNVITDIMKTPRPQGAAYDIGAYEVGTGLDTSPPTPPRGLLVH